MHKPRIRSVFDRLPSYAPAHPVVSASGESHPLAANESPHGPIADVVATIAEHAGSANRYPDFNGTELVSQLARHCGVAEDRVALGAGSVALIQMLMQAVAEAGAEVMCGWRSFELYPLLAGLAGLRCVQVPLAAETLDLTAMVNRVDDRTRLILVCNPNNPTGTFIDHEQLREFVDSVPENCLLAVDEAYFDYVRRPGARSAMDLVPDRPNVVVLRTFSKAYGLAGLRVGYLVGAPYVVRQLRKARLPYSLSTIAQKAALAALRNSGEILAQAGETVAERTRVQQKLSSAGWVIPWSEANFVWLPLGPASVAFGARCAELGVAVRVFPGEGVRVTIGSPADNDAFLAVTGRMANHVILGESS